MTNNVPAYIKPWNYSTDHRDIFTIEELPEDLTPYHLDREFVMSAYESYVDSNYQWPVSYTGTHVYSSFILSRNKENG